MRTRVHINLSVRDLPRSIAFYAALFGAPASKRREDYANWRLDEPGLHLALVRDARQDEAAHQRAISHEHFGIELFEQGELDAWRDRVEAAGMPARCEEAVTCCYAVANKFWVADPDGNEWEFWVRSEEAESMHGADMPLATQAAPCCAPAATTAPTTAPALETPSGCCAPPTGGDSGGCC